MKQLFIIVVFLLTTGNSFAQQNCDCDVALSNLITKIESDYPGFKEKTKDKVLYNSFKLQLKQETKTIEQSSCFDVLKKYTSFFRDGHILWLHSQTSKKPETVHKKEFIKMGIENFEKKFKNRHTKLEGIWKNNYEKLFGEFDYTIGLIKTKKNEYVGFVIKSDSRLWEPKEVKFRLFPNGTYEYFDKDHNLKKGNYTIYNETIISFDNLEIFFVRDNTKDDYSLDKITELSGFTFKKITDKTSLLTLPSFYYSYVDIINRLIEKNKYLLENSPYLIVDVRNNGGGTDNAYLNLLPYIMTQSIRTLGVEFLSTPTLINGLQGYIDGIKDDESKQNEITRIKKEIEILKKNKDQFVNIYGSEVDTMNVKIAEKSPKNIVVLANQNVGSSGEYFVMFTRQSKKVKIFGTPTYGGLDYASARVFDFGCPEYTLALPTYRSLRLPDFPVDNIGLQPDIYMDKFVKDWVKYAIDYLEEN
ncbi:S41 family peptidase [Chryseobacterium sp. Marseille-Q3244]|uniref:S41 family peptidase n=1 Tax=Chryseobacterium sp. Marseille-Q3244 TaxID=2758092 RepID=UPI00202519D7|nr:S41 family peptidase [Chryseobacterium sp. Marseille-Q3244]